MGKKIKTARPIDGLVDDMAIDTNTCGNNFSYLEEAQDLARSWKHLLFLSERTVARDKCFYYHINWEWNGGKAKMIDPLGSNIDLPRGDQEPDLSISRKLKNESHRTLGVCISPDGSWKAELAFLRSKARKYANRLISSNLTTSEAVLAYRTMLLPSMLYSAGITHLSRQQCKGIQKLRDWHGSAHLDLIDTFLRQLHTPCRNGLV